MISLKERTYSMRIASVVWEKAPPSRPTASGRVMDKDNTMLSQEDAKKEMVKDFAARLFVLS